MISYRFKRRAFLTAMSGGLGLKIMLRNLEASAQGMKSPGRLLVTHWPVGIVAGSGDALFKPTSGAVGGSIAMKPFADAGLGPDMTVFRKVSTGNLNVGGGGSHEQGTVSLVTGLPAGGSRANCCEGDDAYAAPGGSFEQILLGKVAALQRPGNGYANSIADSRTDFAETSTQCLSYSTTSDSVTKYNNAGSGQQALPLKPVLSPMQQYTNLFGSFVTGNGQCGNGTGTGSGGAPGSSGGAPGTGGAQGTGGRQGGTGGAGGQRVGDDMLKKLACKRSVLDFALEELNQMKMMVPAGARNKLDIHTSEIMKAEASLKTNIDTGYPDNGGGTGSGGASGTGSGGRTGSTGGSSGTGSGGMQGGGGTITISCATKPAAPAGATGKADTSGNGTGNDYGAGNDTGTTDDAPTHQAAAKAHMDVLKAAFVCDVIRVGTFQWSPGTNHVSYKGMYPNNANGIFQHHPLSHRIGAQQTTSGSTVDALEDNAQFLYNVQYWLWQRHAENIADWKKTVDGCGNSLLDFTVVPFVTEVDDTGHGRSNMVGMIFGGKSLGFIHDKYQTGSTSINAFWGTIGQAFGFQGNTADATKVFGTAVSGVWTKPA